MAITTTMDNVQPEAQRARVIDLLGLAMVPVVLTLIHFLVPASAKELLVFRFHDPAIPTAWTASLIHRNVAHLAGNLLGYTLASVTGHHLFVRLGQRRRFWITGGLICFVTPFVTTAIGYWFLHLRWGVMAVGATSRGFSGVVVAFGGMLLAILTLFLTAEYDKFRAGNAAGVIVLVGLGLVADKVDGLTPFLMILLGIGLLAGLSGLVSRSVLLDRTKWSRVWARNSKNLVYVTYSGIIVCLFMLSFIPETSDGGLFSNAIAHATGFTVGLVLTLVVGGED